MSGTMKPASAVAMLREGIVALARADGPRLELLAAQAGNAAVAEEERGAAGEEYAALGLLLTLTRRNLRLLRGERGDAYGRD